MKSKEIMLDGHGSKKAVADIRKQKHKVTLDVAVQLMMDESAKVTSPRGRDSREPGWKKDIIDICTHYAEFLKLNPVDVFMALETDRNYWYANYYQWSKFPKLDDDVFVYDTQMEMLGDVKPHKGFRCPACEGISKSHTACDSDVKKDGKACDWKSYGLFGTMGKGVRLLIKENWIKHPVVHSIFKPIAFEEANVGKG